MVFLLLTLLGEGALSDTSMFNTAAYPTVADASVCDFASTSVINPALASGLGGAPDYDVPWLLEFEEGETGAETLLSGFTNVQAFSATVFQVLAPVNTVFDDTFVAQNGLESAQQLSNGVKMSAAFLGLLNGEVTPSVVSGESTLIAELTGGTAPSVNSLLGAGVPACFGIAAPADSSSTVTTVGTQATYTFNPSATAAQLAYYAMLLAQQPNVQFVEPTVTPVVMASNSALSVVNGDAKVVAQGHGVSGECEYFLDRDFNGAGEKVAVMDDGLYTASTFFYSPEDSPLPCSFGSGSTDACCAADTGCGGYDATGCEATCTDTVADLGIQAFTTAATARRISSYVPLVDEYAAQHGTMVTATIVGEPLNGARNIDDCEEADGVRGVAPGATAVFVDLGSVANDNALQIPFTTFESVLQEFAYNVGANVVNLAWGADTRGAADAVTRSIDAFLVANDDAVVVAAAGEKANYTSNTALAKNAISVGVYSSTATATLRADVSVKFSSAVETGSIDAELDVTVSGSVVDNTCSVDSFQGASAATAIVTGQITLIEEYLKTATDVNIFQYDAAGVETINDGSGYTGATLKGILIAAANDNGYGAEYGNGFGVPTLENVLPFEEEHQTDLRLEEHVITATSAEAMRSITVTDTSKPLIVTVVYTDTAASPVGHSGNGVVNDVRLSLRTPLTQHFPNGVILFANGAVDGSGAATNTQKIIVPEPVEGTYTINIAPMFVATGTQQSVSVVVSGRFEVVQDGVTGQQAGDVTATPACCPWGTILPTTSCFPISFLVLIIIGVLAVGLALMICIKAQCQVKDTVG